MERFSKGIYNGLKWTANIMLAGLVLLCILQVICRYVLQISLSFTEELARYLFIWVTFLGSAMAVYRRQHVKMDLLYNSLGQNGKKILGTVVFIVVVLTYALMFYSGIIMSIKTGAQSSPAMHLPMRYIYLSVPVSALIMIIFEVTMYIQFIVKQQGGTK